jgi:hypothetical protein
MIFFFTNQKLMSIGVLITMIRAIIRIILSIFLTSCVHTSVFVYGEECLSPFSHAEYPAENQEVRLHISGVATLPDNIVFLGGAYYDSTHKPYSALLMSRDGGETWNDTGFSFVLSHISYFQTYGKSYIWALVILTPEGLQAPTHLLRSTDAGETWCLVPFEHLLHDDLSIPHIQQFEFFDEQHGLLSIICATQTVIDTHYTKDGGQSWQRLWVARRTPNIESDYWYPESSSSDLPHAPLWTKDRQHEYYTITGLLRIRKDSEGDYIVLESSDYDKKGEWEERSKLSTRWFVKDNHFIPYVSQGK